jgi:hypothetical protein
LLHLHYRLYYDLFHLCVSLGVLLCLYLLPCYAVEEVSPVALDVTATPASNIITDRPSFTNSVQTVPERSLQFENGATWANTPTANTATFPETVLRLGITPRDEVQLYLPYALRNEDASANTATTGWSDPRIGFKHGLARPLPWGMNASVNGIVSLPLGNSVASSSGVDPVFNLILSKPVSARFSLTQQTSLTLDTSLDEGQCSINPSLAAGYAFTPSLGGFLEYASFIPIAKPTTNIVDAGVQYTFKKYHALDVRVGTGLTNGESIGFVGVGYSYRWNRVKP